MKEQYKVTTMLSGGGVSTSKEDAWWMTKRIEEDEELIESLIGSLSGRLIESKNVIGIVIGSTGTW